MRGNPAGHVFVLRDLFPTKILKVVMIVLLKIYATDKIFGKSCLKTFRDTVFFQFVVYNPRRDRGTQSFGGGDIQQKGKVQTHGFSGISSTLILSLSWTS